MPALFETLPESGPSRRRSPAGAALSIVLHAAAISLAVVATAKAGSRPAPSHDDRIVIWHPPTPPLPPEHHEGRGGGSPVGGRTTDRRETTHPLPPISLPTLDDVPVDPTTDAGIAERWDVGSSDFHGGGAAGGTGGPDTDGVFTGPQVERAAVLHGTVSPRYPTMLRERGVEGSATLRFVVDTTGRVEPASVAVVASTHELFAAAARAALPSLRFTPAQAGGRRVRQLVELPFSFELR